jgi:zinc protease
MHITRRRRSPRWRGLALPLAGAALLAACATAPEPRQSAALQPGVRPASAAPAEVTLTRSATVEGITEYQLSNGLKVLLFPDQTKPTTTVNITYYVGSRHEAYGETGMAHLLEHLLFKGTPNHPNIPQELTERGARPNGTTWFDRTNYFETFPASDDNLAWAIGLEADRMVNSFVRKEDLDSEMTVVRNEFEMGENSPFRVLMQRTMAAAYLWHNYGKSTIGARADLENVPIERLQAFYRKYYQPDNAVLVVAGKFDEERALELVEEKFGAIPRPERSLERGNLIFPTYTRDPAQDGERSVRLERVGDVQLVMASHHVPPGSHEDFAAVSVLAHVLGNAPSGRLHRALVETRKAARVGAWDFQLREPGVLLTFTEVRREDSLDEARRIFLRTHEEVTTRAPTVEEVDRARTALLRNIELMLNNSERVALDLSEWEANGDWRLLFIHRDRIRAVTPEDVRRVAATYLLPSNRTVGVFVPTENPLRAEIPAAPDISALVQDYRGDAQLAQGEEFDPSPLNIEGRTARSTLPSGFKVALLPKQTRGNTVVATVALRLGSEQTLTGRTVAGNLAGSMLMRGTQKRSRQQIRDEFDRLKAQAGVGGNATQAWANIETTRENLPAVLRLVGEVLREPAFSDKEWDELKQEQLATLESQKSEPQALGSIAYNRHLNPWPRNHPRYAATLDEQIADVRAARLADARRFHDDFYGADAGDLAVVGDFDAAEIAAIAAELFGSWKAKQPFARIAAPFRAVEATKIEIETPDKANAFFMAGLNLEMDDSDADYPAMLLANYMMGGGFLNSRLATRIRQRDGLSYGVGSSFSASPLDRSGGFTSFAIYAPENAARLEAAFREEVERALREGFGAEEVTAAKSGYLQSRQVSRAQDNQLARMLAGGLYLQRTLDWDAELERRIDALTPQQIVEAMRRHVDPSRITVVKAGDFAKHRN